MALIKKSFPKQRMFGIKKLQLILEEEKLGTALSIAVTASLVKPGDILLMSPSDLYIKDKRSYGKIVKKAIDCSANNNAITSIVVKSQNNYLPYGYVRLSKPI